MSHLDPLDRIADHALQVAHEQPSAIDLTPRVVAAWARGERGSDIRALVAEQRLLDASAGVEIELEEGPVARPWWKLAAAAALVIAIGGAAAWFAFRPDGDAKLVARAAAPLHLFRGLERFEHASDRLELGDLALVGPDDVASLELVGGGRLVLGPCTLLGSRAAATPEFALERGRVELATDERSIALDVGFARVIASPESVFSAELVFDSPELACADVHGPKAMNELLQRLPREPRRLRLGVRAGGVELEHDGAHETLSAGMEREVGGPASPERLVSEQGKRDLVRVLDALLRGPKVAPWATFERQDKTRELAKDLSIVLEKGPQYWAVLRAELASRVASGALAGSGVGRLVDFALDAPRREGESLARELWLFDPAAFREEQIVALAERGTPEFERELRAMLRERDPARDPIPVYAAAWLASRNDPEALALLQQVLADPPPPTMSTAQFDRLAVATSTLDALGDTRAWSRGIGPLIAHCENLLEYGNPPAAGWLTLALTYLHESRKRGEVVSPTRYLVEAGKYASEHASELSDSDMIRERLEEVRR